MKLAVLSLILLVFIAGCTQFGSPKTYRIISETNEVLPDKQDLQQLGISGDCQTEEYRTDEFSPLAQYSFCNYSIDSLSDSEIVLELKKFTNPEDLNGAYQYESLHLRGFEGLIRENEYGDMSRFYVSNESTVYYYNLWISKNDYLIHVTSKGSKEAGEYVEKIGVRVLSKFG